MGDGARVAVGIQESQIALEFPRGVSQSEGETSGSARRRLLGPRPDWRRV